MKKFIYSLRHASAVLIFLFPSPLSLVQPGMIQGWIKDEKGNPLCGASVTIKERNIGTEADRNGRFKLIIAPGKYTIFVSFVEHVVLQENISIRSREITERNFITAEVYKHSSIVAQ